MKKFLLILLFISSGLTSWAFDQQKRPIRPIPIESSHVTVCTTAPATTIAAVSDAGFFANILDTSLWPARWYCGVWTDFHGWMYISSDLMIWAAYFIIPLILGYFLYQRRKDVPFNSVLYLFIAFILACGLTHLLDAVIFWWPAYKLSAVLRLGTAVVSWGTVFALVKVTPKLLDFKSPDMLQKLIDEKTVELQKLNNQLKQEIEEKTKTQAELKKVNATLEETIEEKTQSLIRVNDDLQYTNSLFEAVQEAANIGVWEINLDNGSLFWSDAVYDIHELPRGIEVKLDEGINFYHDDYKNTIQEAVNKAINNGERWDLKLKLITAKQKEVWVHALGIPHVVDGKTVSIRGLFQNIDKKVKSENKILEHQQNVKAIIENTQDLIWSIDTDYKLKIFNAAFAEAVEEKYKQPLHVGLDMMDPVIDADMRSYWKEKFEKVIKTGKKLSWLEHTEYNNTHSEISVNPIKKNNVVVGLSCISRDVTQFKKQEEMMREINNSLEKKVQERTKSLEENNIKLQTINKELESFSYSVSHDLRSPLRGIHGFTNAIKEDYYEKFDDTGKDYLDRVLAGTVRMGELIDDMLKLSRVSRAEVSNKAIDLSILAQEIFESIDHGEATIKIQPGLKTKGDLPLITTVLQNLLENGIKYSKKIANPRIEFGARKISGRTVYYVSDNGAGFDMQYSHKLFSPFQRLHHRKEFAGNGIGLATVNRIILKHGGKIWAESKINEGATFYFTLK
ncbi:MAG: ATP-binding protein [Fulvivirga sp.]